MHELSVAINQKWDLCNAIGQSDQEKGILYRKMLKFYEIKCKEEMGKGEGLGYRGPFFHLGIGFNPRVSFESIIYRWKAIFWLFLMDTLRHDFTM